MIKLQYINAYILTICIISLGFFSIINFQTDRLLNKFQNDHSIKKDTTSVEKIVKSYNTWILEEQPITGQFFKVDIIERTNKKENLSNQIFDEFALWNLTNNKFHVWQIITHMFMHGGLIHLAFNMLSLITIGFLVEKKIGPRKYVCLFILGGIVASFSHMIMTSQTDIPMIGASGALWAVFSVFAMIYKDEKLALFLLPIYIKAKYLFSLLLSIEIILSFQSIYTTDNLAHWAHIGGALFGFIFYLSIHKQLNTNNS